MLKYNAEVSPYLIAPAEAKKLEEKLMEPKHRAGNFKKRGVKKLVKKGK